MRMILLLALAASLSACALGAHPTTPASVAVAVDRAVGAEATYADGAEFARVAAPLLKPADAARAAELDRKAFIALGGIRLSYPARIALTNADRYRLDAAIDRSNQSHDALQIALAPDG